MVSIPVESPSHPLIRHLGGESGRGLRRSVLVLGTGMAMTIAVPASAAPRRGVGAEFARDRAEPVGPTSRGGERPRPHQGPVVTARADSFHDDHDFG